MPRHDPRWLQAQGIRDGELAALELAAKRADRDGAPDEAQRLRGLRDRLLAAMPSSQARRTEADAEALLEAQGFATRPGPRVTPDMHTLGVLTEALRAPFTVALRYTGANGTTADRLLEPYGMLLGIRRYLVARARAGGRPDAPLPARPHPRGPDHRTGLCPRPGVRPCAVLGAGLWLLPLGFRIRPGRLALLARGRRRRAPVRLSPGAGIDRRPPTAP